MGREREIREKTGDPKKIVNYSKMKLREVKQG